jgi:hypothetical protein
MGDRTQFVPSHVGANVLPNLPFFHKLLRYAQRRPPRISIRDMNAKMEKTFHHVLSDALTLRRELEQKLSAETRRDLQEDKEVYIGLLAPGGYEYTVGFVATLALGAAVVPMGKFRHSSTGTRYLTIFSCRATCGRSLIFPTQGAMCSSLGRYNQRATRTLRCTFHGRQEQLPHTLHFSHRILLPDNAGRS